MPNPDPTIPDAVRRFILMSIPSVPFLEAARLFHSAPQARHSAATLAAALYVSKEAAQRLLDELTEAGIVKQEDAGYGYAPRDGELATALDQLIVCYQANLVGVTQLIHDTTQRSAERFASAFRWRKEPDHG